MILVVSHVYRVAGQSVQYKGNKMKKMLLLTQTIDGQVFGNLVQEDDVQDLILDGDYIDLLLIDNTRLTVDIKYLDLLLEVINRKYREKNQ